ARGREARLRFGLVGRGLRLRCGDGTGLARRADGDDQARLGHLPDARAHARDDRDDCGDAGPDLGRAHASGHRDVGPSPDRGLAQGLDVAPMVSIAVDDDIDRGRGVMRPLLALYVGGMGSRERNFYNQLVSRYGFEEAAKEVQDLYLDGKKDEAAAALPAELIDQTTLCGPAERIKERLAVYAEAGVGTLMFSPMDFTAEGRSRVLRTVAE